MRARANGKFRLAGKEHTLDTQPMDTLIAALLSEDCLEQADAARFLGEIGRREAVPPLVKYVVECRNYAKVAGIEALARIRDASACLALRRLAGTPQVVAHTDVADVQTGGDLVVAQPQFMFESED